MEIRLLSTYMAAVNLFKNWDTIYQPPIHLSLTAGKIPASSISTLYNWCGECLSIINTSTQGIDIVCQWPPYLIFAFSSRRTHGVVQDEALTPKTRHHVFCDRWLNKIIIYTISIIIKSLDRPILGAWTNQSSVYKKIATGVDRTRDLSLFRRLILPLIYRGSYKCLFNNLNIHLFLIYPLSFINLIF